MSTNIHLPKRSEKRHQHHYFRLTQSWVNEDTRLELIIKAPGNLVT